MFSPILRHAFYEAVLIALGFLISAGLIFAAGTPVTSQLALQRVNAERISNGLPAVTLSSKWSAGCQAHDHYLQLNGWNTTHSEDPSKPGYSAAGASAASHAQLYPNGSWTKWNIFENAPFHLVNILRPQLSQIGFDETSPYTCLATIPAATTGPNNIYTYPGDNSTGIYYAEKTLEDPDPVEVFGLQSNVTGPYLMAFADGSWLSWLTDGDGVPFARSSSSNKWIVVKQASLTDSSGTALPIKTGDTSNAYPYLVGVAFIIPISPLKPNSTYHASITLGTKDGTTSVSKSWIFTTGAHRLGFGDDPPPDDTPVNSPTPAPTKTTTGGTTTTKTPKTTTTPTTGPGSSRTATVKARLTKTKFSAKQARKVKLVYRFSKPSDTFTYALDLRIAGRWTQIQAVQSNRTFAGRHVMSVRKLFGSKHIGPGSYRLRLYPEKGHVSLKFKIIK